VLIDEAEVYLHYDAQADLINVFTEQLYAAKIIYTTHSAGCLPRDLGNGIRAVSPIGDTGRSTFRNNIWGGENAGVSPLVFAMGATTFAFLPARHVLMVEGNSDAMLYPTLFREASETELLDFQVVPRLATVTPSRLPQLLSDGGAVAFLVDGDAAGDEYCRALLRAGVPAHRIFSLKRAFRAALELEDLIDPKHYAAAVNATLKTFKGADVAFSPREIPAAGRTAALAAWCSGKGFDPPDKTVVAERLLDMKATAAREAKVLQLLAPKRDEKTRVLLNTIATGLHTL
jgi:predicted ATP-dependent endonuclease of OLD family